MSRRGKVRAVALFEFLCTVRSKGWLIATFGMPVFLLLYAGLVSIPILLESMKQKKVAVYGVVDPANLIGLTGERSVPPVEIPAELKQALRVAGQDQVLEGRVDFFRNIVFRPYPDEGAARSALRDAAIAGYCSVPPDYLTTGAVDMYGPESSGLTGSESRRALGGLLTEGLLRGKVSGDLAARIRQPIVEARSWVVTPAGVVKKGGGVARMMRLIVPVGFSVLLLISIFMSAGGLIQATAIEKENKVVEVLLSCAKADEILMGKLLGLGAAGSLQMVVWFGMLGLAGLASTGALAAFGFEPPWEAMIAVVLYFPVAYLFFGSLMLGTGSLGSNQKEANQWGMIWSLMAVVPMMFLQVLLNEPHGTVARVLTWIPVATPITMVVRLAIDPEATAWWEVAGSTAALLVWTWLAIKLGGRLFRVGILLTGARPKLREILRQARLS